MADHHLVRAVATTILGIGFDWVVGRPTAEDIAEAVLLELRAWSSAPRPGDVVIGRVLGLLTAAVVAGLVVFVIRHGRPLFGRGELADVPDGLDEVLRGQIDGDVLGCGCPQTMPVTARCPSCGWRSCLAHAGATHLCEPVQLYDWQHDWPVVNPTNLDNSAAMPNELLTEIYQYLESAQ